jgi:hypothetical protein
MLMSELRQVLDEYELRAVEVDALEALLVGESFALRFVADREALDVSYLEHDRGQLLAAFMLRPLIMERFTAADRMHYGNPVTAEERLAASVRVYAAGLAHRCGDVLSGDRSWIRRAAWETSKPGTFVQDVLQRNCH